MTQDTIFNPDGTASITLPSGTQFQLQQVSSMAIYAIQTSQINKPRPPFVEVKLRSGKKKRERNPDDPTYQTALASWEQSRQSKIMQYIISNGVVDDVPNGYEEYADGLIDTANESELKFFWVAELISAEDLEVLSNAIVEMAQPSEEGIEDAEAEFQGDSK